MKVVSMSFALAILAGGAPVRLKAIELQPGTLQVWDNYVSTADSRMRARVAAQEPFLWADEAPDRITLLQRGEVLVAPVCGRGTQSVPNGLIHDWIGAVFIPNATLASLLAVIHDYDRYKEFYKPAVVDSKVLGCTDSDQSFSMIWQRRVLLVNASVQGQYEAHDFAVDERHGYSITATTRVQEIESYGHSGEHVLPPGQGNGFIWRLHSIVRYQERDGGLYLELEAIALTRDIPASLRWVVKPVVNRLSITALATSLRQTRDAVNSQAEVPDWFAVCAGGAHNSRKAGRGTGN